MFLRVSGTLRNPPGIFHHLTMPRTKIPGTSRVEFNVSSEGLRRLNSLKKSLGLRNRDELLEALLYKVSGDESIDLQFHNRIEYKIDWLVEKMDLLA